ncbi:MAG: adenylate/guanylate cyclase domain-containing protein [Desulfobacteraceae bacterium]|nr:adenylate/guanylate cyclase domain-containing protein [Desulfobacteraceae bacterium]
MSTDSGKRIRVYAALAIIAFALLHALSHLAPGLFENWNSQILDRFFQIRSSLSAFRPPYDPTVVHVDLNDTAIRQIKTFYLTRSHYAHAIRNLSGMKTAAQVYDLIFAARTAREEDQAIIDATEQAGNAYFGMAVALVSGAQARQDRTPPETREYLEKALWRVKIEGNAEDLYTGAKPIITFSPLATVSRGTGFLSLNADPDGVIRRVPLLVRYGEGVIPSLPFRVLCDYLGVPPERITVNPGLFIRLEGARKPGGPLHDLRIPIDRQGNMIVNFAGPWETMLHYNFAQILAASGDRDEFEIWTEELAGKIAVISDISTGATDLGPVPVDVNFPLAGLHANVIHTILTENFLVEVAGWKVSILELALLALLTLMCLRLSPSAFIGGSVALIAGYGCLTLLAFLTRGLLMPVAFPLTATAVGTGLMLTYRYFQDAKEKEAYKRMLESYFPPPVVRKILANPEMINRGQRKELTILFSDIKDFTTHSSTLSPDAIRSFLNEYFESMVDVVFTHQGTVDKYIGDGLMVFFGDPEAVPDHALHAARAAIAMLEKVREMAVKWEAEGGFPLQIRIGINTGEVVVGNMGSSRRPSYTVLGSAVNLAKRLESSAPVGGILISERTHELITPHVPTEFFGEIRVKGYKDPVSTHVVVVPVPEAESS